MKHYFRFVSHCITFFVACLPLMILGIFIIPIAIMFSDNNSYKLPFLFRWWDCADLYAFGRDTSEYRTIYKQGSWARYKWLCFRNPINYFDYIHLGLLWNGFENYTYYNSKDNDVGDDGRAGFRYIEVLHNDSYFYEYCWVYRYPFNRKACFRYRMGWKIANNDNPRGTCSQWCLTISPYRYFNGK